MTASVRGSRARCTSATSGLRISATTAATMNSSRTTPGRVRERVQREDAERQHDELHPARDDHRRGRHGGACSSGVAASSAIPRQSMRRARCSRDHLVRRRRRRIAGQAHAAGPSSRAARTPCSDLRRRQRRERRGRARHHAEDRRRAVRARGSTSSRSATTPTTAARSSRTSTSHDAILRPYNYLRNQPGHGAVRRRARRRAPRRREPQRQPLRARRATRRSPGSSRRSAS